MSSWKPLSDCAPAAKYLLLRRVGSPEYYIGYKGGQHGAPSWYLAASYGENGWGIESQIRDNPGQYEWHEIPE